MEMHDPEPASPEPMLAAPAPVGDVTPDVSPADLAEDLPDLPPMEFDTGDFDFGSEPTEGDSDFAVATRDIDGG